MDKKIAIVIRTKNSMPYSQEQLLSLKNQTRQDFSIYAFDLESSDATVQTLVEHVFLLVRMKDEKKAPGAILNEMIGYTKEPIVVLLQGEAIPQGPDWLQNLIAPIEEGGAEATFCRQIPRKDAPLLTQISYERLFDETKRAKNRYFFSDVACAFSRKLWEKRPFYAAGFQEDLEWSHYWQDMGVPFQYLPEVEVNFFQPFSIKEMYTRGLQDGEASSFIFQTKPSFTGQLIAFFKDIGHDFLCALKKGKFWLIPYHIAVKASFHWGFWLGKRSGYKKI